MISSRGWEVRCVFLNHGNYSTIYTKFNTIHVFSLNAKRQNGLNLKGRATSAYHQVAARSFVGNIFWAHLYLRKRSNTVISMYINICNCKIHLFVNGNCKLYSKRGLKRTFELTIFARLTCTGTNSALWRSWNMTLSLRIEMTRRNVMYKADSGMEEKSRHISGRSRLRSPPAPFFGGYFTANSLPQMTLVPPGS